MVVVACRATSTGVIGEEAVAVPARGAWRDFSTCEPGPTDLEDGSVGCIPLQTAGCR